MLGVHELLKMKGLETATFEGALAMLAAFVLTLPIEDYLPYLPADGNMIAYGLVVLILMGTTVLAQNYNYEDVVYPIASSFYVGLGFHSLVDARIAGIDKVLFSPLYCLGDRFRCLFSRKSVWETQAHACGFSLIKRLKAVLGNLVCSCGNCDLYDRGSLCGGWTWFSCYDLLYHPL